MSTKIRLCRMGSRKNPFYRIIVANSRSPRDGKCLEEIGYYDPIKESKTLKINKERAVYWLNTGAQLSETVKALFKKAGINKN